LELYNKVGEITFDTWETDEFNKYNQANTDDDNNTDDGNFNFKTKNATMIFELNG